MENNKIATFNSPMEVALRMLLLINQNGGNGLNKERLAIYDYFVLNSGDFPNAPSSLHPALPNRSLQLYIKREVIDKALNILIAKELAKLCFTPKGIYFKASEITSTVINMLESEYFKELQIRIEWVVNTFSFYSDSELDLYVSDNGYKWKSEFSESSEIPKLNI